MIMKMMMGILTYFQQRRQRLQHVSPPSQCNNQTNFFCWYQCINVPISDFAEQYIKDEYSLYCLNPALLSSSNNQQPHTRRNGTVRGNSHFAFCILHRNHSWQRRDDTEIGNIDHRVTTANESTSLSSLSRMMANHNNNHNNKTWR